MVAVKERFVKKYRRITPVEVEVQRNGFREMFEVEEV